MQDDHVGRAAALALVVVRRRSYLGDDGGFGTQLGRNHTRTARTFTGADFLLAHDETLAAARGRDCAETRMRDKLERAPAQRLRRISGCCCRRAASLERDGRAGLSPTPAVQLRDAFVPLTLYSLDAPDNTLLAHRPRQYATWLMFPKTSFQLSVPPAESSAAAPCRWSATRQPRSSCVPAACNIGSPARS